MYLVTLTVKKYIQPCNDVIAPPIRRIPSCIRIHIHIQHVWCFSTFSWKRLFWFGAGYKTVVLERKLGGKSRPIRPVALSGDLIGIFQPQPADTRERDRAHAVATTIQARWLPPRRRGRRRGSRTEEGSAPGGCAHHPILHADGSCLASRGDIADGNLFWSPHVGMPRVPAPFWTAREAPCTARQGDD